MTNKEILARYGIVLEDGQKINKEMMVEITPRLNREELYHFAMQMANLYISSRIGIGWEDLADTNSLWDVIEAGMIYSQLKEVVIQASNDRINQDLGI